MGTVLISNKSLQWGQLAPMLDGPARIRLSPEAKQSIRKSHKILTVSRWNRKSRKNVRFSGKTVNHVKIPTVLR